ncbi:MAG TPA: efflux RND transporter permease subunit [Bryobacteraceae bacterium]|nr:efflux RND transporter permease subunit [Bryobacteraceae bacterium]
MWIVKVALNRPYTFIVLGLLILILSPVAILKTPTDIFPNIDIPVVAVAWTYTGMNPEELEGRLTTVYEKVLTTVVDNIQHIESTTVNGTAVVKLFMQPGASIDRANAQVTAGSQTILRQLPPGTLPPLVINYNASTVPILQLSLSGPGLNEQELNDLALNFLRAQLVTVPGAAVPYPYGGKQRQIMVYLDPHLLQSKGLSPQDILSAVSTQNVIAPSGTAKIDQFEYDVATNSAPRTVQELNDLPVKVVGNSTIYLRDISRVSDGFPPQTNIVRQDGRRGVLITVVKSGSASTLNVVQGIRDLLPRVQQTLPTQLKIQLLGDQSVFVRAAISGVVREALTAAGLTAIMILVFLGSWRSTVIIAISIPLAILTSVIVLGLRGETINLMTLGGLALAVGILVDDATVTIENIARHLEEGQPLNDAIFQGAAQIATPAMVSTLCICIVFLPMFSLQGVAHFLFQPLAEAVIFAMLASYLLSRTLVPTLAMYLLKAPQPGAARSRNPFTWLVRVFDRNFERFRRGYRRLLTALVTARCFFVPGFLLVCLSAAALVPWLGQDFFPTTDSGQFILHLRAKTGTRIEDVAMLCDLVERSIRQRIPQRELAGILDNIGLPYSQLNYMYNTSGVIGAGDADILVSLGANRHPTADYIRSLRKELPGEFPGTTFYFLPADMTTQILNFGLPAPVDVQVEGQDIQTNHELASRVMHQLRHVPGLTDLRIQQETDYPRFNVTVDRTKAAQGGYTDRDITNAMLVSLSGSFQTTPTFFLNWQNGVQYSLVTQTPQYRIQSLDDIRNIPISSLAMVHPEILSDVASISRGNEMEVVSHYNIRRVVDIYGAVQDRDLGAVGRDVNRIVDANRKLLPRGSFFRVRGQLDTMQTSYTGLLAGLGFSIVLVYLLIVVNFQSWLDPFIIITALPAALAGIIVFLFLTNTHLSVPALMGAIMCMGVATANSILVIAFANERLAANVSAPDAAIEAGFTRFRPVLMTALAMIIGMIPMALGLGDGGEENAPLGRAVIGGLLFATVATLLFVPAVFGLVHGMRGACGFSRPGHGRWRRLQ